MTAIDMKQYRTRSDHNQTARTATIANALTRQIPYENRRQQRAADITEEHARRLVVMLGHFGELASRLEHGDENFHLPLLQLGNACAAWLDSVEADRAR